MKYFILITFSFLCFMGYAQDTDETVYYLTRSINLDAYDLTAVPPSPISSDIIFQKGWRFVIDHTDDTGHVITFLKWEGGEANNKNKTIYATINTITTTDDQGKTNYIKEETVNYYHITFKTFKEYTKKYIEDNPRWGFVTGAITVPIKVRPAGSSEDDNGDKLRPSDFTGDINIGVSMGLRIRVDEGGKGFIIPSAGLNLTSVSIDESTVRNGLITTKTNASSLTPFVGVIGEYDKFQLAMIMGWDRLSGKIGENWIYQGKPWFGLGLGYNIFNTKQKAPDENEGD